MIADVRGAIVQSVELIWIFGLETCTFTFIYIHQNCCFEYKEALWEVINKLLNRPATPVTCVHRPRTIIVPNGTHFWRHTALSDILNRIVGVEIIITRF